MPPAFSSCMLVALRHHVHFHAKTASAVFILYSRPNGGHGRLYVSGSAVLILLCLCHPGNQMGFFLADPILCMASERDQAIFEAAIKLGRSTTSGWVLPSRLPLPLPLKRRYRRASVSSPLCPISISPLTGPRWGKISMDTPN